MMICGDDYYLNLTPEKAADIVARLAAEANANGSAKPHASAASAPTPNDSAPNGAPNDDGKAQA
jgi:hypothetical protein